MKFPRPELLLHWRIPPPLHGMAPRTILGDKWWNKQRHAAAARNLYKCWACNIPKSKAKKHKWLEGHESYNIDWDKGTCTLIEIVSLCHYCHNFIHRGRLAVLLERGEIDQNFYNDVIKHGMNLTSHLEQPTLPIKMAAWEEWVMIIDGVPYSSRFKDAREWELYYHWLSSVQQRDSDLVLDQFRKSTA